MSVSGSVTPGSLEKKVVEVGDFPFFADRVKHNIERDTRSVHSRMNGPTGISVTSKSYTGTLEFEGAFVKQELDNITRDQSGVPQPLDIDVRSMFEERHIITFEDALVESIHSSPDDGSYCTTLDLIANGVTKTA